MSVRTTQSVTTVVLVLNHQVNMATTQLLQLKKKKSQIVRLEVLSSSGSSIGDLVFYMDADNLYFESEYDSSFPLTGGFSEGLLFSIKRSDP